MNKKLIFSVLLVVCLLVVVAVVSFAQTSQNVRWEFAYETSLNAANRMGQEGWELVNGYKYTGNGTEYYYLKRRLP
jgi:uncharacterized membrane protein